MAGWGGPPFGGDGSYTAMETPKGYRKRTGKKPKSLRIPGWVLSGAAILLVAGGTPFLLTQNAAGPGERPAAIEAPAVAPAAEQPAAVQEAPEAVVEEASNPTESESAKSKPIEFGDLQSLLLISFTVFALGGISVVFYLIVKRPDIPESVRPDDRQRARELWDGFVARHGGLHRKLLEVETDWDLIFRYPALTDATVATTRQFHRALRAADSLSAEPPSELDLSMDLSKLPYPQLVLDAEDSWHAAWDYAQRTGTKLIPREERGKLDRILQLLSMARDSGGSDHERAVAYQRAEKLIGELSFVRIPETALRAIEAEQRKMIEAAPAVLQPADSGLLLQTVR